jgi:hypothetical protein
MTPACNAVRVPDADPRQSSTAPTSIKTYGRSRKLGPWGLGAGLGLIGMVAVGALIAKDDDGERPGYLSPTTPTTSVRLVPSPTIIGGLITPTTKGPDITIPPRSSEAEQASGAEDELMPDVVCMNLQDAQDEIQKHGVFLSDSKDATGKGRHQLLDRNWIVVAQEPEAGAPIGENEAMLSVVKNDEPNDC